MDRPSIICPFVISDTPLTTLPLPQYTPASLASLLFLRCDKYSPISFHFFSSLSGFFSLKPAGLSSSLSSGLLRCYML